MKSMAKLKRAVIEVGGKQAAGLGIVGEDCRR
jgi:hypothetical protein